MAIKQILQLHAFDNCMGLVIMGNMALIIIETDHAAHNDDGLGWVDTLGWLILVIFIVELVLRVFVYGRAFFKDGWNLFDFCIIATDSVFSLLGVILGNVFPMSMLRIFRLCKLARVSKVFRVFPELRVMMAGLAGSLRAIFWGTMLLAFVVFVWAIIAVQFIHPLNEELREVYDELFCDRCSRAYSSVLQSTLTFAQQTVAGDSWGEATIPLIEAYPWTALFFLGVHLTVGMAVMNLILGVVVNVACSEHERLQNEMEEVSSMKKMSASDGILSIIADHDVDGDGELSLAELEELMVHENFCVALAEMDLKPEDLSHAFSVMDHNQSGTVTYVEFVRVLFKMQDSDSSFMLETLKLLITQVRNLVIEGTSEIQNKLIGFEALGPLALEKFVQEANELRQTFDKQTNATDKTKEEKLDKKPEDCDATKEEKFVETDMVRLETIVPTNVSEKFVVNFTPPQLLAVATSGGGNGDTKSTEQCLDAKHVGSLESRPTSLAPLTPHVDERDVLTSSSSCLALSCSGSQEPQGRQLWKLTTARTHV